MKSTLIRDLAMKLFAESHGETSPQLCIAAAEKFVEAWYEYTADQHKKTKVGA